MKASSSPERSRHVVVAEPDFVVPWQLHPLRAEPQEAGQTFEPRRSRSAS